MKDKQAEKVLTTTSKVMHLAIGHSQEEWMSVITMVISSTLRMFPEQDHRLILNALIQFANELLKEDK